jgi:perosamine synthetase
MELKILNIKKENLRKLMPKLDSLEKNWVELGEKPWTNENYIMELPMKWGLSFCIVNKKNILGYIIGSIKNSSGRLNKILVKKEFRRKGIATLLWKEFLRRCREKGVEKIEFKALTKNQPAIDFYKKKGCIIYGISEGEDRIIRLKLKYILKTKPINHSKPTIEFEDINKVTETLSEGNLATGKNVNEFIEYLSSYIEKDFGIATNSGTNALHLALRALNTKKGDEIIIPSYICASVWNSIRYCNASPVLVDINKEDYNISFEDTIKKISQRTKAIIAPHMFGNPIKNIERFTELKIPIIEDCATAVGAEHNNKKIGSFGDIAIFSFYATKMMTSGTGGMILTSKQDIYKRLLDMTQYDKREDLGESYNYIMNDFQAALGLSQLKKLNKFIERRKKIAQRYSELLENSEFRIPEAKENIFFRYIIEHHEKEKLLKNLKKRGVTAEKPVYKPLHNYLKLPNKEFPNTTKAYNRAISLPIYPSLTNKEVESIAGIIQNWRFEEGIK